MRTSESVEKVADALSKAQGEFPAITRNREVVVKSDKGNYKFEYATLDHILALVRPAMTKHGLAISWGCRSGDNGAIMVVGRLLHASGQWLESELPIFQPSGPMKPQEMGSALAYRKRYICDQLLGLSASEDDDANAESGNSASFRDKAPARAVDEFPPKEGPIGRPVAPAPPATAEKVEHEGWVNPLMQAVAAKESKEFLANILAAAGWKRGKPNGGLSEDGLLRLKEQLESVKESKK